MENSDDIKEEVRARIEKFEEIVRAITKHQKDFSEIKSFLETSFPCCIILQQQQNECDGLKIRLYELNRVNLYFLGSGDTKEKINKIMEEEKLGNVDSIEDYRGVLSDYDYEGGIKYNTIFHPPKLRTRFWSKCDTEHDTKLKKLKLIAPIFNKVVALIAPLEIKLKNIRESINEKIELIRKSIEEKELVVIKMLVKKEHLCEEFSSAEEFLLSIKKETSESFLNELEVNITEMKERLESVSFGETALEEKKRIRSDKKKEIANSATEFKKLDEEKKRLDEEIFSISDFITKTKTEISENEKKISISLEVKKNINIDVLEKVYEECKKMEADLKEEINSFYFFRLCPVFSLCSDFINRTFIKDVPLLEKWLAMGKKAMVIRNKEETDLMWKEWNDEEKEMMQWYFTERRREGFSVNEVVLIDISKAQG